MFGGQKRTPVEKCKRFSAKKRIWRESDIADLRLGPPNIDMSRILFLGDIVGRSGRQAVIQHIQAIREKEQIDLVIVNGENAAGGSGLTKVIAEELHAAGVDGNVVDLSETGCILCQTSGHD